MQEVEPKIDGVHHEQLASAPPAPARACGTTRAPRSGGAGRPWRARIVGGGCTLRPVRDQPGGSLRPAPVQGGAAVAWMRLAGLGGLLRACAPSAAGRIASGAGAAVLLGSLYLRWYGPEAPP